MTLQELPPTAPQRARLTVDDFLLLDRSGAFAGYAKTELLDGEILVVNAQHRPHMFVKSELAYRLRRTLEAAGSTLFVGTEGSVALSANDLPEPDIVVTSEPLGEGPVPAASIALIVEVAHTTLALDMGTKRVAYARAGIPEYWVADVEGKALHQMWDPIGDAFTGQRRVPFGSPFIAATLAGLTIETNGL